MSAPLIFTETIISGPDVVDFGVTDNRGRKIGHRITIVLRTYSARTDGAPWGVTAQGMFQDGASLYRADTMTTRNGAPFGASQPDIFGDTLEEVQAKAQQRREGARKRYTKQNA